MKNYRIAYETGLAALQAALSTAPAGMGDAEFKEIASSDFMPRLELKGGNSDLAKKGLVPVGSYALTRTKDDFTAVGKTVKLVVLAWRPKALDTSGDAIIFSYDPKSAEFGRIKNQSEVQDSGCMYGPEFLVYVADHGFATFYCGSKTSRNVAGRINGRMHKAAILGAALIEGAKHSWHGPTVTDYDGQIDLPEMPKVVAQVEKFLNPPAPEVERDEDTPAGDARPR